MTVGELKEILNEFDDDLIIKIQINDKSDPVIYKGELMKYNTELVSLHYPEKWDMSLVFDAD